MVQVEHYEYKGYAVDGTPADCAQLIVSAHPDRARTTVGISERSGSQTTLLGLADELDPGRIMITCRSRMSVDQFRAAYPDLLTPRVITSTAEYVLALAEHAKHSPNPTDT